MRTVKNFKERDDMTEIAGNKLRNDGSWVTHEIKTEDRSTGNSDEKERLELRYSRREGGGTYSNGKDG